LLRINYWAVFFLFKYFHLNHVRLFSLLLLEIVTKSNELRHLNVFHDHVASHHFDIASFDWSHVHLEFHRQLICSLHVETLNPSFFWITVLR
jgi:hypothetical protein